MCSNGIVKEKAVDLAKRGSLFIREMFGGKKKAPTPLQRTSLSKQADKQRQGKCCPTS